MNLASVTGRDKVNDVILEARPEVKCLGCMINLGDAGVSDVKTVQNRFPACERYKDVLGADTQEAIVHKRELGPNC